MVGVIVHCQLLGLHRARLRIQLCVASRNLLGSPPHGAPAAAAPPTLEPGWYRWRRNWFEPPSYTPLEPHEDVLYRYDDHGTESLRVVDRYTYELREDEMYMADTLAP